MTVFKVCRDDSQGRLVNQEMINLDEPLPDNCKKIEKPRGSVAVFGFGIVPQLSLPGLPKVMPHSILVAGGSVLLRKPELGNPSKNFAFKGEVSSLPFFPLGVGSVEVAVGPEWSLRLSELYYILKKNDQSGEFRWPRIFDFINIGLRLGLLLSFNYAQVDELNYKRAEVGVIGDFGTDVCFFQDRQKWAGKRPSFCMSFGWQPKVSYQVYDSSVKAQDQDRQVLCGIDGASGFCSTPSPQPKVDSSIGNMKIELRLSF